jgi:hypothetical protein
VVGGRSSVVGRRWSVVGRPLKSTSVQLKR